MATHDFPSCVISFEIDMPMPRALEIASLDIQIRSLECSSWASYFSFSFKIKFKFNYDKLYIDDDDFKREKKKLS